MERKKRLLLTGNISTCHANDSGAAFTLAEVLITLGIIGIVAAMTLPALVGKYQKVQTVNQLKKNYSELNQALLIAQKDYGTIDSWDLLDFENANERSTFFGEKYLFPHIKTIKKCFPVSFDCWAEKTYTLDNKTFTLNNDGRGAFISASGYSVLYWVHATGNGGWFWVDTNGPLKKPNTLGKDIFPFVIAWGNADSVTQTDTKSCFKRLGFYPFGLDCSTDSPSRDDIINGTISGHPSQQIDYNCKKGSGSNHAGAYCGALLMYDGWQMKEDYPW